MLDTQCEFPRLAKLVHLSCTNVWGKMANSSWKFPSNYSMNTDENEWTVSQSTMDRAGKINEINLLFKISISFWYIYWISDEIKHKQRERELDRDGKSNKQTHQGRRHWTFAVKLQSLIHTIARLDEEKVNTTKISQFKSAVNVTIKPLPRPKKNRVPQREQINSWFFAARLISIGLSRVPSTLAKRTACPATIKSESKIRKVFESSRIVTTINEC